MQIPRRQFLQLAAGAAAVPALGLGWRGHEPILRGR